MNNEALHLQANNVICEGYGCFNKATTKINVKVGQLGSISLDLCANCTEKFDVKDLQVQDNRRVKRLGVENNEAKELR
jgi:hypothetical protein